MSRLRSFPRPCQLLQQSLSALPVGLEAVERHQVEPPQRPALGVLGLHDLGAPVPDYETDVAPLREPSQERSLGEGDPPVVLLHFEPPTELAMADVPVRDPGALHRAAYERLRLRARGLQLPAEPPRETGLTLSSLGRPGHDSASSLLSLSFLRLQYLVIASLCLPRVASTWSRVARTPRVSVLRS